MNFHVNLNKEERQSYAERLEYCEGTGLRKAWHTQEVGGRFHFLRA